MSTKEANDLLDKLLAVADKIGGREAKDVEYYVDKLSRAATRERTAAFDKVQELHKRLARQSIEMSRIKNMPALPANSTTSTSATARPQANSEDFGLESGHPYQHELRLRALASFKTTPAPNSATDSSHSGMSGCQRKAGSAGTHAPSINQQPTLGVDAASTMTEPSGPTTQQQPGYGHFNPERLLAPQATPSSAAAPATSQNVGSLGSLFIGPPTPAYEATEANTKPVGHRRKQRGDSNVRLQSSTLQSVDELLDEAGLRSNLQAGRKRKESGSSGVGAIQKRRKQLIAADHPAGPHCIACIADGFLNCDGKSHCNHCASKKCVYILCTGKRCQNNACMKIHPGEYDLKARKSGEPRWLVLHDNVKKDTLSQEIRTVVNAAMSLMATVPSRMARPTIVPQQVAPPPPTAQPLAPLRVASLPVVPLPHNQLPQVLLPLCPHVSLPNTRLIHPPQDNASTADALQGNSTVGHGPHGVVSHSGLNSSSSIGQHSNTYIQRLQPDYNSHPFKVPEAVRSVASRAGQSAMSDPIRPSPSMTGAAPTTTFNAYAGLSPFGPVTNGPNLGGAYTPNAFGASAPQPASLTAGVVGPNSFPGGPSPYVAATNASTSAAVSSTAGTIRPSQYALGRSGTTFVEPGTSAFGAPLPAQFTFGGLPTSSFTGAARPTPFVTGGSGSSSPTAVVPGSFIAHRTIKTEEEDD